MDLKPVIRSVGSQERSLSSLVVRIPVTLNLDDDQGPPKPKPGDKLSRDRKKRQLPKKPKPPKSPKKGSPAK